MAGQTISSLDYTRVTTSTSSSTLPTEISQSATGNTSKDEFSLSLNSTAVAKIITFTLGGTLATGDVINAVVAVGSYSFKYIYETNAADTIESAAQRIAKLIDSDDNVVASSVFSGSTATITVKSAIPGQDFTLTTSKTGTVAVGSAATTAANAGTALKRKVIEATWAMDDTDDGYLTVTGTVKFFDGGNPGSSVQTQTTAPYKHPRSIESIRTAQSAT